MGALPIMACRRVVFLLLLPGKGSLLLGAGAFVPPLREAIAASRVPALVVAASGSSSRDSIEERDDADDAPQQQHNAAVLSSRRRFASALAAGATSSLLSSPRSALAGIDPSSLRKLPVEGDSSGASARLKQLQGTARIERGAGGDGFATAAVVQRLPSGVSYTEVRPGREGNRRVQRGSNVGAEISVRSTPDGRLCYSTKIDNGNTELAWTVGFGDLPAGLEEGMMGMGLNAVRRVVVPARLVLTARIAEQLPEATTEEGRQCYEGVFRSDDASLEFEVFVTGVNQGDNKI